MSLVHTWFGPHFPLFPHRYPKFGDCLYDVVAGEMIEAPPMKQAEPSPESVERIIATANQQHDEWISAPARISDGPLNAVCNGALFLVRPLAPIGRGLAPAFRPRRVRPPSGLNDGGCRSAARRWKHRTGPGK